MRKGSMGSLLLLVIIAIALIGTMWYFADVKISTAEQEVTRVDYLPHKQGETLVVESKDLRLRPGREVSLQFQVQNTESARCKTQFYVARAYCKMQDVTVNDITLFTDFNPQIPGGSVRQGLLKLFVDQDAKGGRYECYLVIGKEKSDCSNFNRVYAEHSFPVVIEQWRVKRSSSD